LQNGYPSEKGMTFKKWKGILKDIEVGFKAGSYIGDNVFTREKHKGLVKKFDRGMRLFSKL